MLEKFVNMMKEYPPGTTITVIREEGTERKTVIGHSIFEDAAYLITLESGRIHMNNVAKLVRKG